MKVFILGASGFIGNVLAEKLVAKKHEVIGLVRSESKAESLRKMGVTPLVGDATNENIIRQGVEQSDAIVHLAQLPVSKPEDYPMVLEFMVNTRELLVRLVENTNKKLLNTSGTAFYPDTSEKVATEETPLANPPMFNRMPELDNEIAKAKSYMGITVRPCLVYGRGKSGNGPIEQLIAHAKKEGRSKYVGEGNVKLSFIHVDDLADFYVHAIENIDESGLYNVSSDDYIRTKDYAEAIAKAAGLDNEIESISADRAQSEFANAAMYFIKDMRVSNKKAKATGWIPQQPSVVVELSEGSYQN